MKRNERKAPGMVHPGDRSLPTSWVGRSWRFAGALASVAKAAKARKAVVGLEASRPEGAIENARALVASLGHLKGAMLKVGQMFSYLDPTLSDEERSVLTDLQDAATPMAPGVAEAVVESEWGERLSLAVEEWQAIPVAAASIGQVHRARLMGGRLVAVKVQYPDIVKALQSDLKSLGVLGALGGLALPGRDTGEIAAELEARLLEECDYELEAQHQREFRRLFRDVADIVVPDVIPAYSTRRVLTTEFIEAQRFNPFAQSAGPDARNRAGLAIARFAFESIFRHGMFNCDPHPGNYLFYPNGQVVFLDFGCVKRFSPRTIVIWKEMMRAGLEGDRRAFDDSVVALGLPTSREKFDFNYHYEMFRCVSRPWLCDEFEYDQDYIRESNRALIRDNPNRTRLKVPRDFVFVNRLQWGLNSVLATLRARGRFREMVLPWIYNSSVDGPVDTLSRVNDAVSVAEEPVC